METRSPMARRPLYVAFLASALLMLSDGLPVVHATIPYYPYPCPIESGGRDFDGNGDEGFLGGLPTWDPRSGLWFSSGQGANAVWGTWGDIPTPGDFDHDGIDDYAVFRPSTGTWFVKCSALFHCPAGPWGMAGDIPVPADYNADGFTDFGVWRPSNGRWYVRDSATGATLVNGRPWGQFGDCPIAASFGGGPGANMSLNVWRPANGVWYYGLAISGTSSDAFALGAYGDIPFAPALRDSFNSDFLVFRPSTGTWYGFPTFSIVWGQPGDIPAPRSELGGQISALTVYRPTTGLTYNCFSPGESGCAGGTNVEGPSGSPGVVPLQGKWK